jgi:hypothetical protein
MRADDRAIDDKIRMPFCLWFLKDRWSVLSPLSGSDGLSSYTLRLQHKGITTRDDTLRRTKGKIELGREYSN